MFHYEQIQADGRGAKNRSPQQIFFIKMIPCDYNKSNVKFRDTWDILIFLKVFSLSWYVNGKILVFSIEK